MGFSEIKIDKNELFCTIFDLKSSVSWLISLEMIKYVDYYLSTEEEETFETSFS